MSEDLLNRPVWNSLSGTQKRFGIEKGIARRFLPKYGPLSAAENYSDEGLNFLAELEIDPIGIWVFDDTFIKAPIGLEITQSASCVQMILHDETNYDPEIEFVNLFDIDAKEMLDLAALTQPGPFSTHTHQLGAFIGIRVNNRLVAMAGERMRIGKYTEVSGVCTHPQFSGRGYAKALSQIVTKRIIARGEIPFLHSYQGNETAIGLYAKLGFQKRAIVNLTILNKL